MEQFSFEDIKNFEVFEFSKEYAEQLAKMWNESDADWPGGFTGGIELTGERLVSAFKKVKTAARYVLYDRKKDKICAVLECFEIPGNTEGVYAGVNIHPDYRGAAILLLAQVWIRTIDKLVEKKYRYLFMETWPDNVKSIVISKQSGFWWIPNTSVRMENYFPLLMRTPIILKFFEKNDIVECQYNFAFQRNTDAKEDKIIWKGIEVFIYHWRSKNEYLKAIIDVRGKCLTGFEDNAFAIYCYPVDGNTGYAGCEKEICWEVINKKKEPLDVAFDISCESGLKLEKIDPYFADEKMPIFEKMRWHREILKPRTFTVTDKIEFREKIIISPDVSVRSEIQPAHRIYTKVFVDGELAEFETGIMVKELLNIEVLPERIYFFLNEEKEIILNIKNNYLKDIKGALYISFLSENFELDKKEYKFEIKKDTLIGIPVTIKAKKAGVAILYIKCIIDIDGQKIETKTKEFILSCVGESAIGGFTKTEMLLENKNIYISVDLKTGKTNIYDKFIDSLVMTQNFGEIGPPFSILGEDSIYTQERIFLAEIKQEKNNIIGIISTALDDFPGLKVTKEITLNSSSLVKIDYKFYNTSVDKSYSFEMQVTNICKRSDSKMTISTKDGILSEYIIGKEFPAIGDDLSGDIKDYQEFWSAYENPPTVFGLLWKDVDKIEYGLYKMPNFTFNIQELKKLQQYQLPSFYIYSGFGTWQTIRFYYQNIFGKIQDKDYVIPKEILSVSTNPEIIIYTGDECEFDLIIKNYRKKEIGGVLEINSDKFIIDKRKFLLSKINVQKHFIEKIKIRKSNTEELQEVCILPVVLQTELRDYKFEIPVCIAGEKNSTVNIEKIKEQGKEVIKVDNNNFIIKSCAEFSGSIFSLKKKNKENLISSFPKTSHFSWFSPWYGGISPIFVKELSFPVNVHQENYSQDVLEKFDKAKNLWSGIKISAILTQRDFSGIHLELNYLTLPNSNILLIKMNFKNKTSSYFNFFGGLGFFLQVGGANNNSIVYFEKHGKLLSRKRTIYDAWTGTEFAAVENPETKDVIALYSTSFFSKIIVADLGILGAHLFAGGQIKLKPQDEEEFLYFLVLTDSITKAENYKILSKNKPF